MGQCGVLKTSLGDGGFVDGFELFLFILCLIALAPKWTVDRTIKCPLPTLASDPLFCKMGRPNWDIVIYHFGISYPFHLITPRLFCV